MNEGPDTTKPLLYSGMNPSMFHFGGGWGLMKHQQEFHGFQPDLPWGMRQINSKPNLMDTSPELSQTSYQKQLYKTLLFFAFQSLSFQVSE